jgi:PAS domain S-box-containing protein
MHDEQMGVDDTPEDLRRRLAAAERRLGMVQQVARSGCWEFGRDTAYWSEQLYRLIGLGPQQAEPSLRGFLEAVHPHDLPRLAAEVERAARRGGPLYAEVRLRAPAEDGGHTTVVVRGVVDLDPEGGRGHAFGTVTDVTEARRLEQQLRVSEERFRMAFEQAPVAMTIADAAPGSARLLWANQSAAELFGVPVEALLQRDAFDFVHADDVEDDRTGLELLLGSDWDVVSDIERRMVRPSGEERWAQVTMSIARHPDGSPAFLLTHLVDVTARHRADAEARRVAERDERIATVLQDQLLPLVPRRLGPLSIATRYEPAGPDASVGGDWQDVFFLPGGRIGVVVGDVAGHGIDAAVTMNRLRHVVRVLATSGSSPAGVLRRLNDCMHDLSLGDQPNLATLVHLQLDPAAGVMRSASAGHLPVLTLGAPDAAGRRTALPVPALGGPPIGVVPDHVYREHTMALDPHGIIIGFTDGLIERRDRSLDEGLLGLLDGLGRLPRDVTDDVEQLADAVLALGDSPHEDDVAVIVVAANLTVPVPATSTRIDLVRPGRR